MTYETDRYKDMVTVAVQPPEVAETTTKPSSAPLHKR